MQKLAEQMKSERAKKEAEEQREREKKARAAQKAAEAKAAAAPKVITAARLERNQITTNILIAEIKEQRCSCRSRFLFKKFSYWT